MLNKTHRQVGLATGVGVAVACTAPLAGAAIIILTARATSMVPDHMERWFGVKRENHRTWTHWLLVNLMTAIFLGLVVYGIGYAASYLVLGHMHATTAHDFANRRDLSDSLHDGGVSVGVLIGIGVLCGTVSHSLIDACTFGGVPLLGPFSTKKRWLVPMGWRTEVGDKELEAQGHPFQPTRGERRWKLIANVTTIVLLATVIWPQALILVQSINTPS